MATLEKKLSLLIKEQLPEFVKHENLNFIAFMKAYYEFLESGELVLTSLGSVDAVLSETQPATAGTSNYIIFQDTNRYRPDEDNKILLEDTTNGAFINGETITGQTSKATATVRVEDINENSRLFISAQNKFLTDETVIGATTGATGKIVSYTANPVQNVSQLLEYFDVDETIDSFFTEFKETFLRTLPDKLATSTTGVDSFAVDKRKLLKNIKDLYRSKGTKKGHELFFRILLKEDPELYYPTKDVLRTSDGSWIQDTIIRITQGDSTILMEDASTINGDIFLLMEDGGQIQLQDSVYGTSSLLNLSGQTITQSAVIDPSIAVGQPYYGLGYPIINKATATVEAAYGFDFGGDKITELVINKDSIDGTFYTGHTISGVDNSDSDVTLIGKLTTCINSYNATSSSSTQYLRTTDPITITADNGERGAANIASVTSGTINEIIVDSGGSGYEVGDVITVTNDNTGGTALGAAVELVNGGIAPEAGDLVGEFEITLESGTSGGPGEILTEFNNMVIKNRTGVFSLNETITGQTSKTTATVLINDTTTTLEYSPVASTLDGSINASANVITVTDATGFPPNGATLLIDSEEIIYIGVSGNDLTGCSRGANNTTAASHTTGTRVLTTFVVNEVILGATSDFKATIVTLDNNVYIKQQKAYDMEATDHIILENQTVYSDGIVGNKIAQESGTGSGDVTDVRITSEGYGYYSLPTLALPTTSPRTGGTVFAKGTSVGKIGDINIGNPGAHYTTTTYLNSYTNFLCTTISGSFILNETVTGGTSGATARYKDTQATINILSLDTVVGTFVAGETITGGTSGESAVINSYTLSEGYAVTDVIAKTSGAYSNQDGWVGEKAKRIQDSYYYQDFSYVVKTGTSINNWRDELIAAIHPAGFALFGQIDLATAVQSIANITSITGLGPVLKRIFITLFGRRLGTTDQAPINPTPDAGNQFLSPYGAPHYGHHLKVDAGTGNFTFAETITGGTSGATGKVASDVTADDGVRIVTYVPVSGIFVVGDLLTGGGSGKTATVFEVYGLRGFRDVTLNKYIELSIRTGPTTSVASALPAMVDAERYKFANSMVDSATSTRTFTPGSTTYNVYPVYLTALTTITSAINASVTTIPVAATDNLPTEGTIKLGTEEITYTGRSTSSGAGNLTGATRGANSTTAASHLINANLTLVRNAIRQGNEGVSVGYRIQDWATDYNGQSITLGDVINTPGKKNNISPPTELTIWVT